LAGALLCVRPNRGRAEQIKLRNLCGVSKKPVTTQIRFVGFQAQPLGHQLEPLGEHLGEWPGALHPLSPTRIIIGPTTHGTQHREHVPVAPGVMLHQPALEDIADLQR
jgi:hypothetical protein